MPRIAPLLFIMLVIVLVLDAIVAVELEMPEILDAEEQVAVAVMLAVMLEEAVAVEEAAVNKCL
jgi:hypothetical protein